MINPDKAASVRAERAGLDHSWVFERIGPPPLGWGLSEVRRDGVRYTKRWRTGKRRRAATLIVSGTVQDDGRRWLHMSMSCVGRVPSWAELVRAKEWVFGRDSKAIQVIPPRSEYVNIHPHVLHLFVCVDGDPLPDFTAGTGSI